jgi:Ni,Fe-hydrogenase III component G
MTKEETLRQELVSRFPALADKSRIQRDRRLWVEVPYADFRGVFDHAVLSQEFSHLCTITGLDEGENLSFVYHLARPDGIVLCLKTSVPKSAPAVKTISDRFPGGMIYERELEDMFGAKVEGLPPGRNYPLPEGWPAGQHPLRKEWKTEMLVGGKPDPEGKPHG